MTILTYMTIAVTTAGLLVSGGMIAAYCLARAIFGRKR